MVFIIAPLSQCNPLAFFTVVSDWFEFWADCGKCAKATRVRHCVFVNHFFNIHCEASQSRRASLRWSAGISSGTVLGHLRNRPFGHNDGCGLIGIQAPLIVDELRFLAYQYNFQTYNDLPTTVADLYPVCLYIREILATMRAEPL